MRSIVTEEQKTRIIKESNGTRTDLQLAHDLGLKYATFMYWKNHFRKNGLIGRGIAGRPTADKQKNYITSTDEFNRMTKEEQDAIIKAKLAEVMATMNNAQQPSDSNPSTAQA